MQNKIIRLGTVLFGITAVTGLILGAVQAITSGPIAATRARQKNDALAATLPGAARFDPLPVENGGIITEIFSGTDGEKQIGYNFTLTPKGFGGLLTLICGIDTEGRVMDISILESSETPGLGARASEPAFAGQFHERLADGDLEVTKTPPQNGAQIQAISGATITSRAVTEAVNVARRYWSANFGPNAGTTAPKIATKEDAFAAALPGAAQFTPVPVRDSTIEEIIEGTDGGTPIGHAFLLKTNGYSGPITIVCGIDAEGSVTDIFILKSDETPGLGSLASEPAFSGQFRGLPAGADVSVAPDGSGDIQAISGATVTSTAVTDAVNAARRYWAQNLKNREGK